MTARCWRPLRAPATFPFATAPPATSSTLPTGRPVAPNGTSSLCGIRTKRGADWRLLLLSRRRGGDRTYVRVPPANCRQVVRDPLRGVAIAVRADRPRHALIRSGIIQQQLGFPDDSFTVGPDDLRR